MTGKSERPPRSHPKSGRRAAERPSATYRQASGRNTHQARESLHDWGCWQSVCTAYTGLSGWPGEQ